MTLFDNDETEEFLLFVQNSRMTLEALGMISINTKLQHILTLSLVEVLHQFDTLCDQMGSATTTNFNHVILSLGM